MENDINVFDTPKNIVVDKNKLFKQIKTIFTTMFGRKMDTCIIGAESQDNIFYFTNIPLEDIEIYEHDASAYIHQVKIFDYDFLDMLFEAFPIFKDHILYINPKEFVGALNKELKSDNPFKMFINNDSKVCIQGDEIIYEIGEVISMFTASLYKHLFVSNEITNDNAWIKELKTEDVPDSNINKLVIHGTNEDNDDVQIFLTPCFNTVAIKEYLSKFKPEEYRLLIKAYGKRAIKIECQVDTNQNIRVCSIQPGIRYYK